MTDRNLTYLGPIPGTVSANTTTRPWWRLLPLPFLIIVVLPTLLTAVYYLLIASPKYVSEARFIVRAANEGKPSALGITLQGVGLSAAQSDAFAVHEYIGSRDGFDFVKRRFDLRRILGGPNADILSRYPRPWEDQSDEAFYKAFQRFLVVGYDSTTGISTIRTEAFTPRDAQVLTSTLLDGGEQLVNRMNDRAAIDSVRDARAAQERARQRLSDAQRALTAFRNRERFIDPARTAQESSQLIGGLLATLADARAERAQIAAQAPQSPQLPIIDSRIRAYESQIAQERAKITGDSTSLAPKLSAYQDLDLNREFADRELTSATEALTSAEQEATRKKLYLDRIVNPNLPDKAMEPKRLLSILTVLISCLVLYGIGWFIWAGAREHRQD